jgi:ammonia channel protein AmtB
VAYWAFGFGLMYGRGKYSNPFFGVGDFFVNVYKDDQLSRQVFTFLFLQISFCSTSTTLASGGAAERFRFSAYIIYCLCTCFIYSIGAGWIWGAHGFLKNLGVIDFAGSGPVHIIGGAGALTSAYFIGPRIGRYDKGTKPLPVGNNFNILLGLFILMWGWYGFNVGSGYGISGDKWDNAARAGLMTVLSSMATGFFSILYSMKRNKGKVNVLEVASGILSAMGQFLNI